MYVRFIAPEIVKSAPELLKKYKVPNGRNDDGGFGVCSGFILSNSETGHATFTIAPRLTVLACSNGMIFHKDKIAERHLGTKMDVGTFDWSEDTRQKELELIQCQVKDAVNAYLSTEYLGNVLNEISLKGSKILDHPVDAIQNISLSLGFSEERKNELLSYFVQGGDTTDFGAVQSLTYLAQKVQPVLRYELETVSIKKYLQSLRIILHTLKFIMNRIKIFLHSLCFIFTSHYLPVSIKYNSLTVKNNKIPSQNCTLKNIFYFLLAYKQYFFKLLMLKVLFAILYKRKIYAS